MIHLQSIQLQKFPDTNVFPFNLPLLQSLKELRFDAPVTILVGENGTEKSTLLEGLACAAEMVVVGSESMFSDRSLAHARNLAKYFKLSWVKRTHRGFFLRAEDFFGYAKRLNQMRSEMESDLSQVEIEYKDRDNFAREQAKLSYAHELIDMRRHYGEGLDIQSHGESFLALFQSRFVPNGLYLLDEPEAPLSTLRQLALIAVIKNMVTKNGQFIFATHSPILMAYPEATILNFDGGEIHPERYENLEHVRLMRDFLQNPELFLRNL
ncbi:MAG: heme ABC transporter ATP-binding protein CcmA [Anaerolineales bacterium]|jgi:predicted ATPase